MNTSENSVGRQWSKRAPLAIVFVLSAMFLALSAAAWFSATFLDQSDGFVGAAEVLLTGIIAGLLVGAVALVFVFRLSLRVLMLVALPTMAAALVLLVVMVIRTQAIEEAKRDPEADYAGIATFKVSLEQIVVTDPYLRVRMEVDSNARRWISTGPAPDHQVCTGLVRAARLQKISKAMVALASVDPAVLADATIDDGAAHRRLVWHFDYNPGVDGPFEPDGSLTFSDAQANASPALARAVSTVGMASVSQTGGVKCD